MCLLSRRHGRSGALGAGAEGVSQLAGHLLDEDGGVRLGDAVDGANEDSVLGEHRCGLRVARVERREDLCRVDRAQAWEVVALVVLSANCDAASTAVTGP